jgi:hypothetical protein
MKIFYLILAHDNLHQLNRMVFSLRHQHVEFYIHLDAKVPIVEARKYEFYHSPDVKIIKTRYKITWGGYNIVRATIGLIKAVCRKKEPGYLVLLSGQDFPIKPAAHIYDFLNAGYGKQYLQYFSLPHEPWLLNGGLDRIRFYWFNDTIGVPGSLQLYHLQSALNLVRPYFEEFSPYGGSQWWCITYECAIYILKFLKHNPLYAAYFEHSFISDELFFHTLIINSPFSEKTVNDNLRYIDWNDATAAHPRVFSSDDWPALSQSEMLWARKFLDDGSSDILDRLEDKIGLAKRAGTL